MIITILHKAKEDIYGLISYDNKSIYETNNTVLIKKQIIENKPTLLIHLVALDNQSETYIREITEDDLIIIKDNN